MAQHGGVSQFQDQLDQEEANAGLKDFSSLFADAEVEAKYKRVEEAQAIAADPSTYVPEIEEEDEADKDPKKAKEREKLQRKKAQEAARQAKQKKKAHKKEPPPWKKLLRIKVELRELRVKSIDHHSTYLPVLHPCTALTVQKKLGAELKRDWQGIRLIYMGELLQKDTVLPEECYKAKRFNFLRWVDDMALQEHMVRLKRVEEKKKSEEEKMIQLLKERQQQQQQQEQQQQAQDNDDRASTAEDLGFKMDVDTDTATPSSSRPTTTSTTTPPTTSESIGSRLGLAPSAIQTDAGGGGGGGVVSPKNGQRTPKRSPRWSLKQRQSVKHTELLAFDLSYELDQINCQHFADALMARGFGDKGAFAYITEEEVTGPGLWINPKAARRIMALADFYKRQIEMEIASTTTQLATISQNQSQENKYTLDGVTFYNTQVELNAAVEAERRRKMSVYVRPMSVKKDQSTEVKDLSEAIQKRLLLEEQKAEGLWSTAEHVESHFCCQKHRGIFDAHIEEIVKREGVDYDNDFQLMLMDTNWNNKGSYMPGDAYRIVITQLFTKHNFPFRQRLLDDIMKEASLDDNGMIYDQEVLRRSSVKLLQDRKRHLLLDLQDS